ncbi:MAG TPA: hypothetical protein VNA19_06115 [Pyrinomonadaceae bacterium]|nr:hypothetical protein [Pyrinomonadaceae bacterium]
MPQGLIDRLPTEREIERLRLILSTYQDGTGTKVKGISHTVPGWRDFERAVALAFGGEAQESKAIFDVLLPSENAPDTRYGLSCKMRRELNKIGRTGRVSLELSNSAGQFWSYLRARGIDQHNYRDRPLDVGVSLIEVVESWHHAVSLERGGNVDLSRSSYLVLSWNPARHYQLHQFPLTMPNPSHLHWYFPSNKRNESGRRIAGDDKTGTLFEWYGESGGQLKYYPLATNAIWASEIFRLEPLGDMEYGILNKAASYFPEKWAAASSSGENFTHYKQSDSF